MNTSIFDPIPIGAYVPWSGWSERYLSFCLRRGGAHPRLHHERLDGSGYPDGLKGDAIPMLAEIMGVVDVFDAVMTERPYKMAASAEHAKEELMNEAKKGWRRKDFVEAFIGLRETAVTV